MWTDPIVKEVHAIRKQIMEQAGGDLHEAILLAHRSSNPNRKVFRGQPRRPAGWLQSTTSAGRIDTHNPAGATEKSSPPG
jgi:hypothetical protein